MKTVWQIEIGEAEEKTLSDALRFTTGKLAPAAKMLGISLPTARKKAKQFGLWPWKKRKS